MTKKTYEIYENVTKEVLDKVCVGDLVKCNGWSVPYRVKGVSEHYFVMTRKQFGKWWYSICEKKPWPGVRHNAMVGGKYHISTDDRIFGWYGWDFESGEDYDNPDTMGKYLQALEDGEIGLSERRGFPLEQIAIKHM